MPILAQQNKITRMPVNPLDKCTVVNLYPRAIHEVKPTLSPGVFDIPAAKFDDFEILVVGSCSWFKEMEEGQPFLEITNSSMQVADSICKDWMNGIVGCDMAETMPGLFWVPGALSKKEIKEKFPEKLALYRKRQMNYFAERVRLADVGWARSNGSPLAIDDEARMGAELLGLKSSKAWMQDFQAMELINCKACGQKINALFPVCQYCHAIIDEKKATELNLKFASK